MCACVVTVDAYYYLLTRSGKERRCKGNNLIISFDLRHYANTDGNQHVPDAGNTVSNTANPAPHPAL